MEVICVDGNFSLEAKQVYNKYNVVWPEQDKIYSIREVVKTTTGETGLLLEEIVNPKIPILHPILGSVEYEPNWHINRFRTLQGDEISREQLSQIVKVKA